MPIDSDPTHNPGYAPSGQRPAPLPTQPPAQTPNFIGMSLHEFATLGAQDLKSADATRLDPKVRESYSQFVSVLQAAPEPYYVFVYSLYICIKTAPPRFA